MLLAALQGRPDVRQAPRQLLLLLHDVDRQLKVFERVKLVRVLRLAELGPILQISFGRKLRIKPNFQSEVCYYDLFWL
jgi:hypothetical protein